MHITSAGIFVSDYIIQTFKIQKKMKTEQNLNNAETQTLNMPVVNRSIYPIITKSEMWIGCGNVEYLVETTTEIGENYGGQSSRVIESRSSFQYCG